MLRLALLATLASTVISTGPKVQFTNDSVYKNENILSCEVVENVLTSEKTVEHVDEVTGEVTEEIVQEEQLSKSLVFKENHLLGYTIYDNPETSYIDGLKFDDEWVTDWVVENFDDSVEHSIKVKTVYTDDVSGMLMAAKDGDWSKVLSNPLILLQIFYYILAAVSLILGGFGLLKSRKLKVKTANEFGATIGNEVSNQAGLAKDAIVEATVALIAPLFTRLNAQNSDIIKAIVLSKSSDNKDAVALLDLLKNTQSDEDISGLIDRIKEESQNAYTAKLEAQKKAKEIVEGIVNDVKDDVRF
jgi:hypothetical protein